MRTRTQPAETPLLLLTLIALAGCAGGGGGAAPTESTPERPRLAAATAERLASRSDAVAARLAEGDECGAAHEADALAADAVAAVNAGEIPAPYQEELVSRAQELVNAVNCPPAPVAEDDDDAADDGGEEGERDDEGKAKGKGNAKGKGKRKEKKDEQSDEAAVTVTGAATITATTDLDTPADEDGDE